MQIRILALSLGIAGAAAHAEQAPQPQPAAPGGVIAAAKANDRSHATLVAAPTVMQTTAQVMPDGSVRYGCEEKTNPHPAVVRVQKPDAERTP